MFDHYIQPLVQFLHQNPHWGWIISYVIAFIESLAIIGTVVPGSLTMTAIGVLIGTGVLGFTPTFIAAIFGAYTGDILSYWLGIYYNDRLLKLWPFTKYPYLITKGEEFFKKHGGKSVLIGRFSGPVRSLVPVIAGVLKMSPLRFFPICLLAAFTWAIIYIVPGIILGALSLELPPSAATEFIVFCLASIVILWAITWLTKYFIDKSWGQIDRSIYNLWQYLNVHKSSHWITQALRNPQHDEDHQQLLVATFMIVNLVIFLWILFQVITHGFLSHLNLPIYNFLESVRIQRVDNIMIAITMLGDKHVLLIFAGLILLWLLGHKQWWSALHWVAITLISEIAIEALKHFVYSPRPSFAAANDQSFSFLSGHTLLSFTLFTTLALIITNHLAAKRRSEAYLGVFCVVLLIGFSRLYLGAHWLTDVLGSIFLGITFVLALTLSYRRHTIKPLPVFTSTVYAILVLTVIWLGYSYFHFNHVRQELTRNWPVAQLATSQWWEQKPDKIRLPLYHIDRFGHPAQPLNVQWSGDLATIQAKLTATGWQSRPTGFNLETAINRLLPDKNQANLPLIPMLYHDRPPALLMTKTTGRNQPILMLRLWVSDVKFQNSQQPIWLGTINYYRAPERWISFKKQLPEYVNATQALVPYLTPFTWRLLELTPEQQPKEMQHLKWDGKLLLIQTK